MTTEISTQIVKLDFDYIIDNCKREILWEKSWTIFEYDGYTITFNLESIDVKRRKLYYEIRIHGEESFEDNIHSMSSFPLDKEIRNSAVMKNGLTGCVMDAINKLEQLHIEKSWAYKEAIALEEEYEESIIEFAKELLDQEGITNEEIREAYIESQIEKLGKSYRYDVRYKLKYKLQSSLYLAYLAYIEDKERYDDVSIKVELSEEKLKFMLEEMKELRELVDDEGHWEEIKDELEEIR